MNKIIDGREVLKGKWNTRQRTITMIIMTSTVLLTLMLISLFIETDDITIDLQMKSVSPGWGHIFGTDWLGRDMFLRTLKGLSLSFTIGLLAAFSSALIALMLSLLASWNKWFDYIVTWLIDLFLSVPHLVTLILISFVLGGGIKGVVIGLALTHWPSLARLLRIEIMQLKTAEYVKVSEKYGKSNWWIARHHYLPHLMPQLITGFILLFPHAILHESAITFLGFGLESETPAIGIILAESMRYLSTGNWWLAFFPGLSLLMMVAMFDMLGRNIRKWLDPFDGQRGSF